MSSCHRAKASSSFWRSRRSSKETSSESEDRLHHRYPTVHARGIRSKRSAIRCFANPHQFCVEPQPFGRKEMPFDSAGVFVRVAKLSKDLGAFGIQQHLLRDHKIA